MYRTAITAALSLALVLPATAEDYGPDDLGKALTPTGAIATGNADGTIPAWSGKWLGAPPHVDYDGSYNPNPYPDDEVLYTITAQNMADYAEVIGPGQEALLRAYPDSYRIHVYPTRRDFRRPDKVRENVRLNAEQAYLSNDGLTLNGAYGGVAFPIPTQGIELIYNILTSTAPWFIEAPQVSRFKHANGSVTPSEVFLKVYNPYAKADDRAGWSDGDVYAYSLSEERAPPRNAGRLTLSSNTLDHSGMARDAWQYDPGTRRVRKTPDVQFDYPVPQGPRVVDEQNGFNGSPERFDWKLVGQREMVVPFHNYALESRERSYDDFIATSGHPDPQYIRHELRRVWIVEGTLKEDVRHVYGKRRFYIEEDSWHKVMGDMYDTRGELWRVSFDGMIYAYDAQGYYNNVSIYQDLTSRAYSIEKLNNEAAVGTQLNRREPRSGEFSPAGLRRAGG